MDRQEELEDLQVELADLQKELADLGKEQVYSQPGMVEEAVLLELGWDLGSELHVLLHWTSKSIRLTIIDASLD